MVAGGLDVTSRTTRFTSATEFVMRVEMRQGTPVFCIHSLPHWSAIPVTCGRACLTP